MRKSDLSESQKKDWLLFTKKISEAGWSAGGWEELYENDVDLSPEAMAEFSSEDFDLRLNFFVAESRLLLEMTEKIDGQSFGLHLSEYGDPEKVLDKIIASQLTVDKENCIGFFKELVQICGEVLLETDDEMVRLVED